MTTSSSSFFLHIKKFFGNISFVFLMLIFCCSAALLSFPTFWFTFGCLGPLIWILEGTCLSVTWMWCLSYFSSSLLLGSLQLGLGCFYSQVPGRMGLLVTLNLITSNVYMTINAPRERGFSQIEVWMIGVEGVILLALMEYGFLLALKRYNLSLPKGCKSDQMKKFIHESTIEDKMKMVDSFTFILSILFFVTFNLYYWISNRNT